MLGTLEAPKRSDPLSRFADSRLFAAIVYAVISANCVFMSYAADRGIENYDQDASDFLRIGERIFLATYALEFLINFYRHRFYFFCDKNWKFNWLDFMLVLFGIYTVFLEDVLPNVSWLRVLRLFRLAKALRVLRLIAMVKPLRVLLKSLASTMGTLGWCLLLFSVILFLFALVFVLCVTNHLKDQGGNIDPKDHAELMDAYGSVATTMLTLYSCSTGGNDWEIYYKPLEKTGIVNSSLFLAFVAFTQIAVLNIILGIFVDDAMKCLLCEKEERAMEHAEEERQVEENLRVLCQEADTDKNGSLTQEEWSAAISQYKMRSYLEMMGFRKEDVHDFLRVVSKGDPEMRVDVNTFVRSCMRLKGTSSRFEMHAVLALVRGVDMRIQKVQSTFQQVQQQLADMDRDRHHDPFRHEQRAYTRSTQSSHG